jgi:hypothetical protein
MVPSSVNEVPRDLASSPRQSYLSASIFFQIMKTINAVTNTQNEKHIRHGFLHVLVATCGSVLEISWIAKHRF